MRQIVERLQTEIGAFIAQRDDLVLVVRASEPDTVIVAKIIEGIDESSSSELYWTVTAPFHDGGSFVDACVEAFSIRHEAARLAAEQQGLPPLPAVPLQVRDPSSLAPVERLQALVVFSRSLLPTLTGTAVVWSLLPFQVHDLHGYAAFMAALWRHEFPYPWCHHARMIVRDPFEAPLLEPYAAAMPRVARTAVDLSPDAIHVALQAQAGDETLPLAERVNSCLLLAGIDYSHGRYDRAIQQYDVVHRYAAASQNPTLAAIALNGMADVMHTQGRTQDAALLMQTALAPAALAPTPPVPVLQDLYQKLGTHHLAQRQFPEAEVFLQGAADFAYVMHDPIQRLRALRTLGEAQYWQGNVVGALKTWFSGAVIAGKLEMTADHETFVGYLRGHYQQTNDERAFAAVLARVHEEISKEQEGAAS